MDRIASCRELFAAKCRDMGMAATEERERRFRESLKRTCTTEVLDLREQSFGKEACTVLSNWLSSEESFVHVVLCNNDLHEDGCAALARCFQHNTSFITLDLRSNDITPTGAESIFEGLEVNRTITGLDMSTMSGSKRNCLGVRGCRAFSAMVQVNPVFSQLHARETLMGPREAEALGVGLAISSSISRLDLSTNKLGSEGVRFICKSLATRTSSLEWLSLANNAIGDSGAKSLAEMLRVHKSLETLDVSSNEIGSEGATCIAQALASNGLEMISHANLTNNAIGDAGLQSLVMLWAKKSSKLDTLILAKNGITRGEYIAELLLCNKQLIKLDLHKNALSTSSLRPIADVLSSANVNTLKNLDISGNGLAMVGPDAGVIMAQIISGNTGLQHLSIKDNKLNAKAAGVIAMAMMRNKVLLTLNTDMNDFPFQDHSLIQEQIKKNRSRWAMNAPLRHLVELDRLKKRRQELMDLEMELQRTQRNKSTVLQRVDQTKEQLELTKEKEKQQTEVVAREMEKHREELLSAQGQEPKKLEEIKREKIETSKELMNKIQEEQGAIRRLHMMIERLHNDIKSAADRYESETEELEKQFSLADCDRRLNSQTVEELRKQVQQAMKAVNKMEDQTIKAATEGQTRAAQSAMRRTALVRRTTIVTAPTSAVSSPVMPVVPINTTLTITMASMANVHLGDHNNNNNNTSTVTATTMALTPHGMPATPKRPMSSSVVTPSPRMARRATTAQQQESLRLPVISASTASDEDSVSSSSFASYSPVGFLPGPNVAVNTTAGGGGGGSRAPSRARSYSVAARPSTTSPVPNAFGLSLVPTLSNASTINIHQPTKTGTPSLADW